MNQSDTHVDVENRADITDEQLLEALNAEHDEPTEPSRILDGQPNSYTERMA